MSSNILFFEEKDKKALVVTQVMLKLKININSFFLLSSMYVYQKVELTLTSVHAICQQCRGKCIYIPSPRNDSNILNKTG